MTPIDDFDKLLPPAITEKSTLSPAGNERLIPFPEVNHAIHLASMNLIAVLGVELFRILPDGIAPQNYSGYEFERKGDWQAYVRQNNEAALHFIEANPAAPGHSYILTTASEEEFKALSPSEQRP
jgi:hypothetical protein